MLPAVVLSVVSAERFLSHYEAKAQQERARICAAALVPGPNGDLSASASRLGDRFDRLIAVATLDRFGNVETVYPDRTTRRRAVQAVLDSVERTATIASPVDGAPIRVRGVVVPLNGSDSPVAREALIVLVADSYGRAVMGAGVVLTVALFLVSAFVSVRMRQWFEVRIASPLRAMGRVIADPKHPSLPLPISATAQWSETRDIVLRLEELSGRVAREDERFRQLESRTRYRIRETEAGFDRKLRYAHRRATLDVLTGLHNRMFLEEDLEPMFTNHQAAGRDLAAIMIDVDHFKQFNDSQGHPRGDALLSFVGSLLRGALRPTDQAIRYGGDEFLVLLPGTDSRQAGCVADRIRKLFGQYAKSQAKGEKLTLSAGVASLRADAPVNGQQLIAKADAALYAAKRGGKNAVANFRAA